ncbi:MAG: cell division protein FtsZ [Deltaproteobacteria bacterium]|nr:cell division protein FtsZ [Deltaproteobacteria bacterium]
MSFETTDMQTPGAKIKVIGIGGGGTNAVSTMIRGGIDGVGFIAVNTDLQSLKSALAPIKIQIGKELTKGLGAGSDPSVGRDAALEDRHELQEALDGADMVFITAGMGGGTGTGGASIVAQIARDMGALTVAVVTKPFLFEGKRRRTHAEVGIEKLREAVDTLIVIPNERLLEIATADLSLIGAFKLADNVLVNAVKGISDIINIPGTINVDFADVKTVMSCKGQALMGIGVASGKNRAIEAANQAVSSPLLDDIDIEGASGILINITAGENVSLLEVNEACTIIQESAHEDANIIFGAVIDPNLTDEIRVTVIATGFSSDKEIKEPARIPQSSYLQQDIYKISGGSKFPNNDRRKHLETDKEASIQKTSNYHDQVIMDETFSERSEVTIDEKRFTIENSEKVISTGSQHESWKAHSFEMDDQDPEKIKEEIDKRIDEALELADRVIQDDKEDSLDIPTFLRKGDSPQL